MQFDWGINPSSKEISKYILKGNNNVSLSYICHMLFFMQKKKKEKKILRPNDWINCLTKVMSFWGGG